MPKQDSKGHFIKPETGFTICVSCLKDDWKNYFTDLTK